MFKRQKGFFSALEKLEKTQFWSESKLQQYQERKLKKLISHAYKTVPYYKQVFDKYKIKPSDIKHLDDLKKLPVLDKETLRSNHKKLFSNECGEPILFRETTGSTGVPLKIANNENAFVIERALFYRFYRWMGYKWGDEVLKFWGAHVVESPGEDIKKMIRRIIYNEIFFDTYKIDDELLSKLILKISKFPPKILRGYASSIYFLANKCLEMGLNIKLNAISPTAEKLFGFQRNKIAEAFGENIFDLYGCGETNSIAFECEKHKGLHLAEEHVILEILDEKNMESSSGKVIITNLDNYAMPIIRYENGDLASMSKKKCACQRNSNLIEEIQGRIYHLIEGLNGKKIHTGYLDVIFLELGLAEKYQIKELRIVQERLDKLRFEIVTESEVTKEDEAIIAKSVHQYLGEMEIELVRVESIPATKTGKRMFVVPLNAEFK
jgi:phenylacetate-CoA ligase